MSKKIDFKIISYEINKGKGFAIKRGMLNAQGKYRLFSDLDLSVPIEDFDKFKKILPRYPVIISSRRIKGSKILVHQPFFRESMGRFHTILAKIILGLDITDFTCGFKCFSEKAAQDIFSKVTNNRWGFDTEVLFLSKILKYKIIEVPITWKNDIGSKVSFPKDFIYSFLELLKIRINHKKGLYKKRKSKFNIKAWI